MWMKRRTSTPRAPQYGRSYEYRALGIYREPEFSPGKVEADAAILDATMAELKREGVEIQTLDSGQLRAGGACRV